MSVLEKISSTIQQQPITQAIADVVPADVVDECKPEEPIVAFSEVVLIATIPICPSCKSKWTVQTSTFMGVSYKCWSCKRSLATAQALAVASDEKKERRNE